jgi:OOP family OmpA-OmpF porin
MKSITKFVGAAFAATMLLPVAVMAQDTPNQGYVITASGDIVTSSSGLCWRTSDWTPARSVEQCDPTNKPVAAAAAPAPKATVVAATSPAAMAQPAKQPPQKMSFSADALFAFDQATLKPAGRAMLDDLTRQLKGTTYNVITVTGHADRMGSAGYNQKLSVRRANEVKDYLVSKDIEANRINAQGKGETQPVTKSGECTGKKSAKVIACLQPDRRVDVEMEGAKQ